MERSMRKLKSHTRKESGKKRTEGAKTNVYLKGLSSGAGMNCCQPQQIWPCAMTPVSFWCYSPLYR